MSRTRFNRAIAPALAAALLATAPPATATAGDLPGDLTGGLPGLPGLPDLPGGLPGGLPGDLPGDLPVDLPGGGTGAGTGGSGTGTPGTGAGDQPGGALDASGPVIAGPSKAPTVRVDSKGRFRLGGVKVTCPSGCALSVRVSTANGGRVRFVKRSFVIASGRSLQLKKLKVSRKALRALRSMRVARVVADLKATAPAGARATRGIGLKLKPAKR